MENLDEKHVDMLRTSLSVYEVDGIQCQLTFQKKTITLDVCYTHSSFSLSINFFFILVNR
jgi:hypothetical protein